MMIPVEAILLNESRSVAVDAMIDTSGCHIPSRMTRDEREDFYDGCEIHLYHPKTGRRLKKLEKRVDIDNIRNQIREAGAY